VQSRGVIEFRHLDGRVVAGEYEHYVSRRLGRGETFESDGVAWVMYDREDRAGVTVYLCRPA
jgi:hypothetical protein